MGMLAPQTDVETIEGWFAAHGGTEHLYLREAFPRFRMTFEQGQRGLAPGSTVLDIGAHWLHLAFLFADAGHRVICGDTPDTFRHPFVHRQAEAMGSTLMTYRRLEVGEGIADLPPDSVDLVLFSEILEHLTFNPIPMWSAIYRVLKPGGRILVTTPNAMYFETLHRKFRALFSGCEYGLDLDEILSAGTYGHHWKEYSIPELKRYFERLSPDFEVEAVAASPRLRPGLEEERLEDLVQRWRGGRRARLWRVLTGRRPVPPIDFPEAIRRLQAAGAEPLWATIFAEVTLRAKRAGIVIAPPWVPV